MGRGGCKVEVERGGENRGRGIDGQGDGGGSENVGNRVCCIVLRVVKESDVDTIVGRVKDVDQDDYERGEYVVEIHGGRCWRRRRDRRERVYIPVEDRGGFRMALGDVSRSRCSSWGVKFSPRGRPLSRTELVSQCWQRVAPDGGETLSNRRR